MGLRGIAMSFEGCRKWGSEIITALIFENSIPPSPSIAPSDASIGTPTAQDERRRIEEPGQQKA